MSDVDGLRAQTRVERRRLADLLDDLGETDWERPSACGDWTVRELVAHLIAWDEVLMHKGRRGVPMAAARWVAGMVRARFDVARFNQRSVERCFDDPRRLLQRFNDQATDDARWLFDRVAPGAQLAEYVVHRQDIARPLGVPSPVTEAALVGALAGIAAVPGLDVRRRLGEQRWVADDVDWSGGRGPEAHGPGLEILLALAGRDTTDSWALSAGTG